MGHSNTRLPPPDSVGLQSLWHSGRLRGLGSLPRAPALPPVSEPQFTWKTFAMEGPRLVPALPAVGTGGAATLVDILLTSGACESCWAGGAGQMGRGISVFLCVYYGVGYRCLTELYRHDFMNLKKKVRVYTDT